MKANLAQVFKKILGKSLCKSSNFKGLGDKIAYYNTNVFIKT